MHLNIKELMKKHLKFIVLAPLFMAVLCEDATDECGLEDPEVYEINVENIVETYAVDQTIWLNAQISSMLVDYCTEATTPELITDTQVFLDGLFVLKLVNQTEVNAEVFTDATISYDIGEPFSFNVCSEAIDYLPELTNDNLFYEYRLGISINTTGDYCIVNARNNVFSTENQNNADIFDSYNTLENQIKFKSCNITFTRNGTDGHYFFRVQ